MTTWEQEAQPEGQELKKKLMQLYCDQRGIPCEFVPYSRYDYILQRTETITVAKTKDKYTGRTLYANLTWIGCIEDCETEEIIAEGNFVPTGEDKSLLARNIYEGHVPTAWTDTRFDDRTEFDLREKELARAYRDSTDNHSQEQYFKYEYCQDDTDREKVDKDRTDTTGLDSAYLWLSYHHRIPKIGGDMIADTNGTRYYRFDTVKVSFDVYEHLRNLYVKKYGRWNYDAEFEYFLNDVKKYWKSKRRYYRGGHNKLFMNREAYKMCGCIWWNPDDLKDFIIPGYND